MLAMMGLEDLRLIQEPAPVAFEDDAVAGKVLVEPALECARPRLVAARAMDHPRAGLADEVSHDIQRVAAAQDEL